MKLNQDQEILPQFCCNYFVPIFVLLIISDDYENFRQMRFQYKHFLIKTGN